MRYRKLDANGDYTFGQGLSNFFIDVPEAPAQAARTRLLLWLGTWFLDLTAGVPYLTKVLGKYTGQTRDPVLQATILQTEGVLSLDSYSSSFDPNTRAFTVNAQAETIFGTAIISLPR
jgi:hypothetical protein